MGNSRAKVAGKASRSSQQRPSLLDAPWEPETYRRLFEEVPIGLYRTGHDGRILSANRALVLLAGFSRRRDFLELNWKDLYCDLPSWKSRAAQLEGDGILRGFEFQLRRRDGHRVWVRETCRLRRTPDGTILHEGSLEDISRQVEVRQELERAHAEIHLLLQSISCILIEIGPDERVNRWNSEAEKAFGLEEAEVLGRTLAECGFGCAFAEFCRSSLHCDRTACSNQSPLPSEVPFRRPDGREVIFGFNVSGMDSGRGCLILGRDITSKKQMESQIQQTRKLEAIGQLAAGIAHEINTPTQYVGDNLHFLQDAFNSLVNVLGEFQAFFQQVCDRPAAPQELALKLEAVVGQAELGYLEEEIPEAIRQSLGGVQRIAHIVQAMKDFSHPGASQKQPIDLNHAIRTSLTVSRGLWKHVAEVETRLDPALPSVPGLPDELNQVILNLIVNAAQALEETIGEDGEKGLISIATRHCGEMVEICIRDNGPGIPEEIQHRIFDPFFTTKEVGKGTGQGLAISHSVIVQQHQGQLSFETAAGRGTAFRIQLPVQEVAGEGGRAA